MPTRSRNAAKLRMATPASSGIRNTIRDLMGVSYDTDGEFPADDTGYGFDNIGDVLSLSPLLLEKYISAARAIVLQAVPTSSTVVAEKRIAGGRFRSADGSTAPG